MKQKAFLWIGVLISALFLYIALRDIAFHQFLFALRRADVMPVVGAFFLMLVIYLLRTARWQAIIRSSTEISLRHTFNILMIGFFGNNVLPARAGEFIRAILLRRQIQVTKSFALGTIVVERVTDVAALVGLLLLALYRIPPQNLPAVTTEVRAVALGVLALFVAGMAVLLWGRVWVVELLRRTFALVVSDETAARLASKFDHFSQGLEVLRRPRELALVSALSVLSWAGMVVVFFLVFTAFHFDLPLSAAGFAVGLVNLGMVVPASPGYVGTYEFFMVKSLGAFKIASGVALAFALVTRLLWYLIEVIVGAACLWSSHLPIKQLFRMSRADDQTSSNNNANS